MPVLQPGSWAALLLGAAAAAGAQTAPAESDAPQPEVPGRVMSDVEPFPAEDRDSQGAVVLDDSRVRAQQDAAPRSPERGVVPVVGRNAERLVERTHSWDDVRDAGAEQVPPGEASGAPR